MKVLIASPQESPHRAGPFVDVALLSLAGVVGQERAVEAGVRVLHQFDLEGRTSSHLGALATSPPPPPPPPVTGFTRSGGLTRNASLNSNRQGNCLSS